MEIRFYLCFLELKNPIPEIKNLLNRLNSRLDTAKDKSNDLEDIIIETIQTEARGEKKMGRKSTEPYWLMGHNQAV